MLDKYLTKDQSDALFAAGASSVFQKQANWGKVLTFLNTLGKGAIGLVSGGHKLLETGVKDTSEAANILGKLMLGGATVGTAGGIGYNLAKERMSQNSPEEEMNRKIEAMYKKKTRELEDSNWMNKVIAMRDELRRGYKKMTTQEYTKKYIALMDALNERSE